MTRSKLLQHRPEEIPAGASAPVLSVRDLSVVFGRNNAFLKAVDAVSFDIGAGEILALVGESGCGKSVTSLAVMGLLAANARTSGSVKFEGRELLDLPESEMRQIRGNRMAMVFQEPMTSLNPTLRVGEQIVESLLIHKDISKADAFIRAEALLSQVGIADATSQLDRFPHEMSGGMKQRIMIAIALACEPTLIIADEPTTALDVTIQAQILELLQSLCKTRNIALILVTHNLGIVARYADRINVMYAANQVEQGPAGTVFSNPKHPYTQGLLDSVPRLDRPRSAKLPTIPGSPPNLWSPPQGCRFAPRCPRASDRCQTKPALVAMAQDHRVACWHSGDTAAPRVPPQIAENTTRTTDVILVVKDLKKHFPVPRKTPFGPKEYVQAVDGLSFEIRAGETLGLVGESGCGKTTVGRMVLDLERPSSGEISYSRADGSTAGRASRIQARLDIQAVFQDPYSSLNPRRTVAETIEEPMRVHGLIPDPAGRTRRVMELLDAVGLQRLMAERYPHELSGGQRQRVGIARSLAMEPRLIVCDEPVSALDVSIQGQIVNLLQEMQERLNLSYLFIAHDLAVVRQLSERVVVMYLGQPMESGTRADIYQHARHPYTRALLNASPVPDPEIERQRASIPIAGDIPSPRRKPSGCVFRTRCPMASAECAEQRPPRVDPSSTHSVWCIKVQGE